MEKIHQKFQKKKILKLDVDVDVETFHNKPSTECGI